MNTQERGQEALSPDLDEVACNKDVMFAAQFLGVSESAIRRWVSEGRLPYRRVGRLLRFSISDLKRWAGHGADLVNGALYARRVT